MTKLYCIWDNKIFYIQHNVKDINTNNIGKITSIIKENKFTRIIVSYNKKKRMYINRKINNLQSV